MNYERIRYFIKAAECLNFSEAARQMYITPQAFGRQISLLEDELGAELFYRSRHRISLTYEGELVYKHMAPLIDAVENEYQAMQSLIQKRSGKLNIGMLSFLPRAKCISPLIAEIYSGNSTIDINTQMYEMRELMKAVEVGEVDLGITLTHEGLSWNENYRMIPLFGSQAQLLVSLYHKWVVKDSITLKDMEQMDRIRFDIGHDEPGNPYIGYPCKRDIIVENYATMLSELERGEGDVIVSPELSEISLSYNTKAFPLPGKPLSISLALMYKKSEKRSEVLELIDRIRDIFEP